VNGSSRTLLVSVVLLIAALVVLGTGPAVAEGPALKLRATAVAAGASAAPLTIELSRWSTDVERAPLVTALSAPRPSPAPAAPAGAAPAGGRAGRAGGRGGRAAAPPQSPMERLTSAIKAAPTCGFIWSDGPTGYSIKYAWRSASPDGPERIVLVTDRRIGANEPTWPKASGPLADADFTVIEMRIDGKGVGEGKASLMAAVVVDAAANTLALDGYAAAPVLLKVTR
jgi:hypothetical protein